MRIADLADNFAGTREAANAISPDEYAALLSRIDALRADTTATHDLLERIDALQSEAATARDLTNGIVTAMALMLDGIEKIGEQEETVPPVQYVDVVAFTRLLNRVNAMQTYLTGASAAIPTAISSALAGINNVPQS